MMNLAEVARNRWAGILPALGVPSKFLNGKHQPCPICAGKDRARWDNKEGRGSWICSRCGAGDGFGLLMQVNGWTFRETAEKVQAMVGKVEPGKPKPTRSDEDKRAAMNRLWKGAFPVMAEDHVGYWLRNRVGMVSNFPASLRTAHNVLYLGDEARHPAMLAMVTDAAGKPVNIHRTYLTLAGKKADVPSPRRMMSGELPKGSAVRLMAHGGELGIAEGIETALAAASLFAVPCWAALNATGLASWRPPAGVESVVVFGDADANFVGQAAAYALASRLAGQKGLRVLVEIPAIVGDDWNDVLLDEVQAEAYRAMLDVRRELGGSPLWPGKDQGG